MLFPGKDFEFYNNRKNVDIHRNNLPHWEQSSVIYFVTFRQSDSIPHCKLKRWNETYRVWLIDHPKPWSFDEEKEYRERFARKIEYWLDQGYGSCWLQNDENRVIIENSLKHFEEKRYLLDEFVVALNHVHLLICPLNAHKLSDILKSLKGYTAKMLNKKNALSGAFWQRESYDHIVRNEASLQKIRYYIRQHKT